MASYLTVCQAAEEAARVAYANAHAEFRRLDRIADAARAEAEKVVAVAENAEAVANSLYRELEHAKARTQEAAKVSA
jgi:hypothetical protein